MGPRRAPVSRRDRPAKPPLSRDGLVSVALRIMREEGLEKVTMRRLAAELDTGPASLYVYVRNTAELHGALLDELLAGLDAVAKPDVLDGVTAGNARGRAVDLMCAYAGVLHHEPSLARSVLVLRPSGPHYLRLVDVLLALLRAAGVPAGQAAWGVDILLQHATASAAEHGVRPGDSGADDAAEDQMVAVRAAAPDAYPNIARVRDHLFAGTGEQRARWSFGVLLEGIATTALPSDE
ncbi:TetR/AcrR family transcriptional regulator [Mangrovihabitans endophyticus]|uniref:TetR family transcriptional regulator n=1 Tax=Mangrovihabitans endophyticus TaxID=1751298 RepID=A0A8J3FR27_9ACTN|nr:TetR/AcrR family transcriptional regulator [Mangrovihabitans endophyticus]GGL08292.1 TetR family transcriptional regulator [Mangrovihabitans endophyticus]